MPLRINSKSKVINFDLEFGYYYCMTKLSNKSARTVEKDGKDAFECE